MSRFKPVHIHIQEYCRRSTSKNTIPCIVEFTFCYVTFHLISFHLVACLHCQHNCNSQSLLERILQTCAVCIAVESKLCRVNISEYATSTEWNNNQQPTNEWLPGHIPITVLLMALPPLSYLVLTLMPLKLMMLTRFDSDAHLTVHVLFLLWLLVHSCWEPYLFYLYTLRYIQYEYRTDPPSLFVFICLKFLQWSALFSFSPICVCLFFYVYQRVQRKLHSAHR